MFDTIVVLCFDGKWQQEVAAWYSATDFVKISWFNREEEQVFNFDAHDFISRIIEGNSNLKVSGMVMYFEF